MANLKQQTIAGIRQRSRAKFGKAPSAAAVAHTFARYYNADGTRKAKQQVIVSTPKPTGARAAGGTAPSGALGMVNHAKPNGGYGKLPKPPTTQGRRAGGQPISTKFRGPR